MKSEYLLEMHIKCQIQCSEITEILFLMEATRERDLHKSLKLLLKAWEKGVRIFIDFRLIYTLFENGESERFRVMEERLAQNAQKLWGIK